MINTWFTSDHHFGHKNILDYEKEARPFNTLDEMHEALIDRWNSVVKENDNVYHLGDFAFGKHNIAIASRLNGKKKLILGNHDHYPSKEYLPYFDKLYGVMFWEQCILTHVPIHYRGMGVRWILNVHGHLHSRKVEFFIPTFNDSEDDEKMAVKYQNFLIDHYFNVSVEQNNLTPIHGDVIRDKVKELKLLYY